MADTTKIAGTGPGSLATAAGMLKHGKLVAFPTETVYGLGADATNATAVADLFAVKARPRFNPLIAHVPNLNAADRIADIPSRAETLVETLWPGAVTLVLPKRADGPVCDLATAGLDTIAVRIPAHPVARQLLERADRPIVAPSANRSGRLSPTQPTHVADELGGLIPLIIADGRTGIGVESTIIDLSGDAPVLLRPGGVAREEIETLLGRALAMPESDAEPKAPGALSSHYAPTLPVRLNARTVEQDEALLTFGPDLRQGPNVRNLSENGDLIEAAANLFSHLRELDHVKSVRRIAVTSIPDHGLGEAINDRLRRAAAPR